MTHVPRSSEKFHSSTIKDDDENFQEPAIKNLKLMKVMNILNSIVGEDYISLMTFDLLVPRRRGRAWLKMPFMVQRWR
ncbi:unnamed protein product [Gordionus sp. m RMFG-2023]